MYLKLNCTNSNKMFVLSDEIFSSGSTLVFRTTKTNSSYQKICDQLCADFLNIDKFDYGLPLRTSSSNFISLRSSLGLLRLFSSNEFHIKCKVVPQSVANANPLEPLYCKGLFTTLAITNNPIRRLSKSVIVHKVTSALTYLYEKIEAWLLDRNSKSGLIGVGLASGLRAIS
jgi:hypothetical protein